MQRPHLYCSAQGDKCGNVVITGDRALESTDEAGECGDEVSRSGSSKAVQGMPLRGPGGWGNGASCIPHPRCRELGAHTTTSPLLPPYLVEVEAALVGVQQRQCTPEGLADPAYQKRQRWAESGGGRTWGVGERHTHRSGISREEGGMCTAFMNVGVLMVDVVSRGGRCAWMPAAGAAVPWPYIDTMFQQSSGSVAL